MPSILHLQLFVRHVLPELLGHPFEVTERDLPGLIVVEQPECLEDLLPRILLALPTTAARQQQQQNTWKHLSWKCYSCKKAIPRSFFFALELL